MFLKYTCFVETPQPFHSKMLKEFSSVSVRYVLCISLNFISENFELNQRISTVVDGFLSSYGLSARKCVDLVDSREIPFLSSLRVRRR